MSAHPPELVVSGVPYAVEEVASGHAPTSLNDFLDGATFSIAADSGRYWVHGHGVPYGGSVKFYEKADDGEGKDVRCWRVFSHDDGSFAAMTVSAW